MARNINCGHVVGPQGPQGVRGEQGIRGQEGPQGLPGVGVPTGGVKGQILGKIDAIDYNTEWKDNPELTEPDFSGPITSIDELKNNSRGSVFFSKDLIGTTNDEICYYEKTFKEEKPLYYTWPFVVNYVNTFALPNTWLCWARGDHNGSDNFATGFVQNGYKDFKPEYRLNRIGYLKDGNPYDYRYALLRNNDLISLYYGKYENNGTVTVSTQIMSGYKITRKDGSKIISSTVDAESPIQLFNRVPIFDNYEDMYNYLTDPDAEFTQKTGTLNVFTSNGVKSYYYDALTDSWIKTTN